MPEADSICLACGICCDGTLFAGVTLVAKDNPKWLKATGLNIRQLRSEARLTQPCAALDGCRCNIYPDRPHYCRQFECLLLKDQLAGKLPRQAALAVITRAKRLAGKAAKILTSLDPRGENTSLRKRYQRAEKRLSGVDPTPEEATEFYDLSNTMHRLNLLLSKRFYPSEEEPR